MKMLEELLDQLELQVPNYQRMDSRISRVNVGWHLAHSLVTLEKITESLSNSSPIKYSRRINLARAMFLRWGWFPRGFAKAPVEGRPEGPINEKSLQRQIVEAKAIIRELNALNPNHYFTHPYLGDLKLKQAKRFLQIHTRHHLKVIGDIIQHTEHPESKLP